MKYTVYLLRCRNGELYCGFTSKLTQRLKQHRSGLGSRFTRSRLPLSLVYTEEYSSKSKAMKREREIKKLRKLEKLNLIKSQDYRKLYDLITM